jgi:hypothetical protein
VSLVASGAARAPGADVVEDIAMRAGDLVGREGEGFRGSVGSQTAGDFVFREGSNQGGGFWVFLGGDRGEESDHR